MTSEQKIAKLFQVAVENGWKAEGDLIPATAFGYYVLATDNVRLLYVNRDINNDISLNDIVTNWEGGEVSFIEALCKPTEYVYNVNGKTYVENKLKFDHEIAYLYNGNDQDFLPLAVSIRLHWLLQPLSKRLEWLFETFSHLI